MATASERKTKYDYFVFDDFIVSWRGEKGVKQGPHKEKNKQASSKQVRVVNKIFTKNTITLTWNVNSAILELHNCIFYIINKTKQKNLNAYYKNKWL